MNAMSGTDRDAVEHVEPSRFPDLVAVLWRRQGWAVESSALDDRLYAIERREANERERRALFAVYRSPGGAVDAAGVRDRARVELGPDGTTLATNAGFAPGAVDTAAAHGVDLVGPDDLARLVDALDARAVLDGTATDDERRRGTSAEHGN